MQRPQEISASDRVGPVYSADIRRNGGKQRLWRIEHSQERAIAPPGAEGRREWNDVKNANWRSTAFPILVPGYSERCRKWRKRRIRLPTVQSTIRWNRDAHLKTEKSSRPRGIIPGMIPFGPHVLREACAAGRLCYVNMLILQVRACFI